MRNLGRLLAMVTMAGAIAACAHHAHDPARHPERIEVTDTLAAEPLPTRKYGWFDLVDVADARNPEIIAARRRMEAADGPAIDARHFPNPTVDLEQDDIGRAPTGSEWGTSRVTIGQPVIVGNRRRAEVRWRLGERDRLAHELDVTRRRVAREVGFAHTDFLYQRQQEFLQLRQHERALDAMERVRARADSTEADLARVSLLAERSWLEATRTVAEQTFVLQRLGVLLGSAEVSAELIVGDLLEQSNNALLRSLQTDHLLVHPERLASEAALIAEGQRADWMRAEVVPDVTVRAGVGYDHVFDETFVMGGLSLPIPLFHRNQGMLHESAALQERYAVQREDAARRLMSELMEVRRAISEVDTLVDGYGRVVVPSARQGYEASREAYTAGDAPLVDLLESMATLFEAERTLLRARYELTRAHVRLEYFRAPHGHDVEPHQE